MSVSMKTHVLTLPKQYNKTANQITDWLYPFNLIANK
jgi:hypothetical protein